MPSKYSLPRSSLRLGFASLCAALTPFAVHAENETGLRADFYSAGSSVFSASSLAVGTTPAVTRIDNTINFSWGSSAPASGVTSDFAARWSGQLRAIESGTYTFRVTADNGVRLWVNGQLIIDRWITGSPTSWTSTAVTLTGGATYDIRMDYFNQGGSATARLEWDRPDGSNGNYQVIPAAQLYPFSKPVTITSAGTYVGSWESTDPNSNVVRLQTPAAVTITNSWIRGRTQLASDSLGLINGNGSFDTQLTLRDSRIHAQRVRLAGAQQGRAVNILNPKTLTIENNTFEGGGGIRVLNWNNHPVADYIRIRYNEVKNIDGRREDSQGNYIDWIWRRPVGASTWEQGSYGTNFVIFNRLVGQPGVEIAWNQVINEPFNSNSEDVINMYESGGTSASPLLLHNNYIRGSYPARPDLTGNTTVNGYEYQWTHTGTGINAGDNPGNANVGFIRVHNNQVVSSGNIGIGVFGGNNTELSNNRAVSSGQFPSGQMNASTYAGFIAWNFYAGSTFHSNVLRDNVSGWNDVNVQNSTTSRNDYEYRPAGMDAWPISPSNPANPVPGVSASNNAQLPGTIWLDTEANEFTLWKNKLASNGITLGNRKPLRWNARSIIEAENYDHMNGVVNFGGGVGHVDNGDWIRFRAVDFGSAAPTQFRANLASAVSGSTIQIRLGSPTGTLLGTLSVPNSGNWWPYSQVTASISAATGVKDVYLVFTGAVNLDWVTFF